MPVSSSKSYHVCVCVCVCVLGRDKACIFSHNVCRCLYLCLVWLHAVCVLFRWGWMFCWLCILKTIKCGPGPHSHGGGCLVCVHGFWTVSRILGVSVFVCLFDEEAHPYSMKCVSASEMPRDQHSLINLACVPVWVCVCVCCVQPNIMVNLSSVYNFTQDDNIKYHITLRCVVRLVMWACMRLSVETECTLWTRQIRSDKLCCVTGVVPISR